jgi:acetylglutamate kinase
MKRWRKSKMYKKLKIFAVFVAFLSMPALVNATEIYLKDGNFIQVDRCEEKGGEIIFTLKGGDGRLYSVNKELVKEITGKKNPSEETQVSH